MSPSRLNPFTTVWISVIVPFGSTTNYRNNLRYSVEVDAERINRRATPIRFLMDDFQISPAPMRVIGISVPAGHQHNSKGSICVPSNISYQPVILLTGVNDPTNKPSVPARVEADVRDRARPYFRTLALFRLRYSLGGHGPGFIHSQPIRFSLLERIQFGIGYGAEITYASRGRFALTAVYELHPHRAPASF